MRCIYEKRIRASREELSGKGCDKKNGNCIHDLFTCIMGREESHRHSYGGIVYGRNQNHYICLGYYRCGWTLLYGNPHGVLNMCWFCNKKYDNDDVAAFTADLRRTISKQSSKIDFLEARIKEMREKPDERLQDYQIYIKKLEAEIEDLKETNQRIKLRKIPS